MPVADVFLQAAAFCGSAGAQRQFWSYLSCPDTSLVLQVNYHPEKHARMLALAQHYLHDDSKALMAFPNGSQ